MPYRLKDFRVYPIDIGSHILTLIQNNIGQSQGIMYEKILRKEYKEMKIQENFASVTSISIEISLVN